ncbi:hypothetical protein GOP47_0020389 [Adiantum capillus-veneris]|uniref:Pentatricopeptide repeat-containing protein n=1 Tax=Adiantum capillus-veneris TaxID=13818 RepID=A0A9D4Z8M9_ADICA|nr:hypothetical protein GOP47_0020389 [Adiantum capillus-veneris]
MLSYSYHKMQEASLSPNGYALVSLVNACAELRDVSQGQELYAEIARKGLLVSDVYAGNTLVNMYIKCGMLVRAQEVFDNLHVRDVVSWTSIIGGYAAHGYGWEALKVFEHMQQEEGSPNNVTYVCALKACGIMGLMGMGKELHDKIERKGMLWEDLAVGNALVDMYVKGGLLAEGQKVFDNMKVHDGISWSALTMGYTKCKEGAAAMQCFRQMQLEGLMPDRVAFVCSLKACGLIKNINIVQGLHSVIISLGLLERYPVIGNALIDAYAHCGSLQEAQKLFHKLPVLDIVSWNTLVDGYVRQDCGKEALFWTDRMQLEGMYPDDGTWVCSLKACGIAGAVQKGKNIHATLALSELKLVVGNALVDMYAKCDLIMDAHVVFGKLKVRDVVSWTTLISGYVNHQGAEEALKCFELMQADHVAPNAATFACVLKACGLVKATTKGIEIHCESERRGLVGKDIVVGNALVDMYSKCGMLKEAVEVFDKVQIKDEASWNALIALYANHGHGREVLDCLTCMRLEGVYPNSISFMCSLKACGRSGMVIEGIELHAEIARNGLLLTDGSVGNALVDMYIKCGFLTRAEDAFHELPYKDILSWTSLIAGFVQHECGPEALRCFDEMQLKGLSPDAAAFVCSLKACRSVGAISKGKEIHMEIARRGLLDGDLLVGNSLIEMYASCGSLAIVLEVFDELQEQDTVSWTALIAGYVQQGELECAIHAFEKMKLAGKIPDAVTFLWVLIGCSYAGKVEMGQTYFRAMLEVYGINPGIQHYTCVADLFCRMGLIDRAISFVDKLPFESDPVVWYVLLDACQKFGYVEACRKAFEYLVRLDAKDASAYVCMCNIYAGVELREDVSSSQEEGENEHMCFQGVAGEGVLVSNWD